MSSTNNIVQLISSMYSAEKQFFSSSHSKSNQFIKLYAEIEKRIHQQKEISDKTLRSTLGKGFEGKKLSVHKAYLYKQLLTSLQNYNKDGNIQSKIHNGILQLEILNNKGLTDQFFAVYNSLRKLANEYELNALLLVLNEYRFFYHCRNYINPNYKNDKEELVKNEEIISLNINDEKHLRKKIYQVEGVGSSRLFFKKNLEFADFFSKNNMENAFNNDKYSFEHKYIFFRNFALNNDVASQEMANEKIIALFNEYPKEKINNLERYCYAEFWNIQLLGQKHDSIKYPGINASIKQIETAISKRQRFIPLQAKLYNQVYLPPYKIEYLIFLKKYSEAEMKIDQYCKQLTEFINLINKYTLIEIYSLITELYFRCNNFKKAKLYLTLMAVKKEFSEMKTIQYNSLLMRLLIAYEQKDLIEIQENLNKMNYFLSKRSKTFEVTKLISSFFKNVLASPDNDKIHLKHLKTQLDQTLNDKEGEFILQWTIDIRGWVEQQLKKI